MSSRRRQAGIGVLLVLVMVLVLAAILAGYALIRLSESGDKHTSSKARLEAVADVIDAYASAAKRLPCPANPTPLIADDDGLEKPAGNGCQFPAGTLPWKTLGMRRADAFDPWGYKLSYRVFAGDEGFTRAGGVDMSHCDINDPAPAALAAGRQCAANSNPYAHNQLLSDFLKTSPPVNDKGLQLNDNGVLKRTRAYVVISHGPTFLGAYAENGTRVTPMPKGVELDHANATEPYVIKAFSDIDVEVDSTQHFDDLLVYRDIEDLAKRAGLSARDWPEGAIFNAATAGGVGGTTALAYMGNTYRASGGTFTFVDAAVDGIGINSADSFLVTGAFVNDGELIRVELGQDATRAAFTLSQFGKMFDSVLVREQVRVRFYNSSNVLVGSELIRQGCRADGGLASFVVEPTSLGASFRNVEIEGETVSGFAISSSWVLSEFAACTTASCTTTLAASSNECLRPSITAAFSPASITRPSSAVLTYTVTNGTDNPAHNGLTFTAALPAGLVMANATVTNSCGGSVTTPAVGASGNIVVTGAALANNATGCAISVNVTATAAGTYSHLSSAITASANLINSVTASTLQVQ